jgi:hypothetical protein
LLTRRLLDLGGVTVTDEAVVGLEFLQSVVGFVDQSEAGGLSATELGAEPEDGDLALVGLVELSKLRAKLILGDIGSVGVENITIELSGQVSFNLNISRCLKKSFNIPVQANFQLSYPPNDRSNLSFLFFQLFTDNTFPARKQR